MTLETIAPLSDDLIVKLPAVAAWRPWPTPPEITREIALLHHTPGHDLPGSCQRKEKC